MNVGELKKLLEQYPEGMEVIYAIYSDYRRLEPDDIEVKTVVDNGDWLMHSHPTMSAANKEKQITVLTFPGN